MQVRQLASDPLRTYAVIFEEGDEVMGGLLGFAREEGVDAAGCTAIGAFSEVTLAWFDLDMQTYREIPIREQVEVATMTGDITAVGDDYQVHAHAVVGGRDGTARAGHLLHGLVRPTLEVIVTQSPAHLVRRHDAATGLALIDLSASR